MRGTSHLGKLNRAIARRVARLRRLHGLTAGQSVTEADRTISYITIELDNLILGAIRQFVISSLTGARSAAGGKVRSSPAFSDEGEVGAYVMSVLSPVSYTNMGSPTRLSRRDEFKVRDPRLVERVMASCSASNLLSVQAAYAYNTGVFTDLPIIRNFFAHRNDDTWRKVRNRAPGMGIYGARSACELVMARIPARPVTVLQDWLDDVELFFYELTR